MVLNNDFCKSYIYEKFFFPTRFSLTFALAYFCRSSHVNALGHPELGDPIAFVLLFCIALLMFRTIMTLVLWQLEDQVGHMP